MLKALKHWDPFKIRDKPKFKTFIMRLFFLGIICFIISFTLYFAIFLISDRDSKLSQYYYKLKEWNKANASGKMSSISLRLKIMPSENTMNNEVNMEWDKKIMIPESKINKKFKYDQSYFSYKVHPNYFPVFRFNSESIPVHDSETFCIHLLWAGRANESISDLYESVMKFPECINSKNPRFDWHIHDPPFGVDVKAWKENEIALTCNSKESCNSECHSYGGIYKKTVLGNFCYTYDVLDGVCLIIDFNQYTSKWEYVEGCLDNGEAGLYIPAKPNHVYTFENIIVQARSSKDPFTVATRFSNYLDFGLDLDFAFNVASACFGVSIICLILIVICLLQKEAILSSPFGKWLFKNTNEIEY